MKQYKEHFRQSTPHKLELKKGGACLGCFGLPFFAAGIFMLLIVVQVIPVSNASEIPWWGWIMLLFMGLIFTAVGAGLAFGRKWITLDIMQGRIWIAWGLLFPMRGTVYDLKDYTCIVLNLIPGDSDSAESYEIALVTDNGSELSMLSSIDYGHTFTQANLLCEFLQIPLEDKSSVHAAVIKPRQTTQTHACPNPESISAPASLKSEISTTEDGITIRIPNTIYSPYLMLIQLIPMGFVLFFGINMLSFFRHTNTPPHIQGIFSGFFGLFFIFLPGISALKRYVASKGYSMIVQVNLQGITITQNKRSKLIAADKIIAVDYGTKESTLNGVSAHRTSRRTQNIQPVNIPAWMSGLQRFVRSKGVIIKSHAGIFYIGAGLPDEEVVYLHHLISQNLSINGV